MGKTKIEWTDRVWNPVRGCSRISEGCRNCYAETMAARFSDPGQPFHLFADRARSGSKWTGKVELIAEKLHEPLRWRGTPRVFVNSMSDLFHEQLSFADIDRVFEVMIQARNCTFQVLTKRAHRMAEWYLKRKDGFSAAGGFPLHVHMGVSVENQDAYDERAPYLRTLPEVRFLSCEPLLGPIDLRFSALDLDLFQWVTVGGESGPRARSMQVNWVRSIRDQCQENFVPFFFKQWGRMGAGRMPGVRTSRVVAVPVHLW